MWARNALTSGRFYSRWSFAASLVVSTVLLGVVPTTTAWAPLFRAFVASLGGWAVLASILAVGALAERRLRRAGPRAAVVIAALVIAATTRPLVNDGFRVLLGEDASPATWPTRSMTNLLVWSVALGLTAIAVVAQRAAREGAARVRAAIPAMAAARDRACAARAEAESRIADAARELEDALAGVPSEGAEFDDIRAYAERVRARSHELDAAATAVGVADIPSPPPAPAATGRPTLRELARLRPPPGAIVAALFLTATLPPASLYLPAWQLPPLAVAVLALCAGASVLVRRFGARRRYGGFVAVFVAVWVAAGVVVGLIGLALYDETGVTTIGPAIALPSIAIVGGLATGAIRQTGIEGRRLTVALARAAREVAGETAATRALLRRAGAYLHGRVQSICVVFAAAVDERHADGEETAAFVARVREALRALPDAAADGAGSFTLDEVVLAWRPVLDVTLEGDGVEALGRPDDDAATDADAARGARARLSDIVAEGLLNAVKHADARTARVEVLAEGRGIVVRVLSPGVLRELPGARGMGVERLGAGVRLYAEGADVVLEGRVARPVHQEAAA